jgi:plasmid stability protein
MPSITIKNIPPEIYDKLKKAAESSHRSINSEVIACIEQAVSSQPANPDLLLATARRLRTLTTSYPIISDEFTQAKNEGHQ